MSLERAGVDMPGDILCLVTFICKAKAQLVSLYKLVLRRILSALIKKEYLWDVRFGERKEFSKGSFLNWALKTGNCTKSMINSFLHFD